MAGPALLRWTKIRSDNLAKEIKNYNRRVETAAKKYPGLNLPRKMTVKEVKASIRTVKEYNALIRSLKAATSKTLRPGKVSAMSVWEEQEAARVREQAKRAKRQAQLAGADLSARAGRFYDSRDFLIRSIQSQSGQSVLEKLENWLQGENEQRSMQWRDNYLQVIKDNILWAFQQGETEAAQKLTELYNKLQSMDLVDFLIAQIVDGNQLNIGYLIESKPTLEGGKQNKQLARYDTLVETWSKYG